MSIPTYQSTTIPVISLRPNWQDGIATSMQRQTTITEALDTSEERQARAPRSLYGISYSTLALSLDETSYLRRVVETADELPVACPLWDMACKLTAAASIAATSLTVDDTTDRLFDVFFEHAILWQRYDLWEVVELDTVGANSVTLLAGLAAAYPANTSYLIPLAYGHVPRGPVEQLTDEHGIWTCDFTERFHNLNDQSVAEDSP